jgi:hypothetical protein
MRKLPDTLHPAHDDITASIPADMCKAEAWVIERGLMRHCADGRAELTEAGEGCLSTSRESRNAALGQKSG